MIRTIQRAALDRSLKAARALPHAAARMLGRDDAEVAIDRAEAGVRDVAGRLLFDEELRAEARRRKEAARQRAEAVRLRARAADVAEQAHEHLEQREREAAQRREAAAGRAAQRTRQASARSDAARERAAKTAAARTEAARVNEERQQEHIDADAKRERLDALERKSDALDSEMVAATARDEARRLGDAAAEAKARRTEED
jgi:hypothetical protein